MFFILPALLSYLLFIGPASAQVSAPNCTDPLLAWSFNSLQQSPCLVSAYLEAICNNSAFAILALPPGNVYSGPTVGWPGAPCECNTVMYNLYSACDACQGTGGWLPYSTWTFNCTTKAPPTTFPEPVPDGTRIPQWAYIDTSIGNNWNLSAAQAVGDSPEVTGTTVPLAGATVSNVTPSSSGSSSSSTSTSHSSSSTSAIAGVVGGIVGAALVAGVGALFVFHRRRARSPPSTAYTSGQEGEKMEQPVPSPLTVETPKLYDPLDPATYPNKEYLPESNQRLSSTRHLQPTDAGYSGLPEIQDPKS
jgi:hypothetical protein